MLDAIIADPDNDTPRLALADFLDEYAESNPRRRTCPTCQGKPYKLPPDPPDREDGSVYYCAKCGCRSSMMGCYYNGRFNCAPTTCPTCQNVGTVVDRGLEHRATLIRTQCRLERWREYQAPAEILEIANSDRVYAGVAADQIAEDAANHEKEHLRLQRLQDQLVRDHVEWAVIPWVSGGEAGWGLRTTTAELRRGLVWVTAELGSACWVTSREDCPSCHGSRYVKDVEAERHNAQIGRQPMIPPRRLCRKCGGGSVYAYHPTDWLHYVAASPDVEAVAVRQPAHSSFSSSRFGWVRPVPGAAAAGYPPAVWDLLTGHLSVDVTGSSIIGGLQHKWWATAREADEAMGRAIVRWARRFKTRKE